MLATGGAIAGAVGVGWVGLQWLRYGHPSSPCGDARDTLLDRFLPAYDVVERHHIGVRAPAATTLDVARQLELGQVPLIRAIFAAREWLLGGTPDRRPLPPGLIDQVRALGWGVLAERPGRAIVMGAVTRPWEANPTFRAIAPEAFATFAEPAYVKIAWTLRADPIDASSSVFRTETRAVATDREARDRFRIYWACLSPGIWMIRRATLRPLKREAERRARAAA
jgi:hypothetical protein